MSTGAADERPHGLTLGQRAWVTAGGALALVVALVPPLSSAARSYDYAAALQFSLLAIVVPALLAIGAPWSLRRPGAASAVSEEQPGPLEVLADRRRRHPELTRTLVFVVLDLAVVLAWRAPSAVALVARHAWMAPVQAVVLVVFGIGLWWELVESPPLVPRSGPLRRAVLAAVIMWVFWVDAYVVGLSNSDWYRNFHHVAGQGLSAAADQQVAAVILWFVSAVAFVPLIFWDALRWIRSEEDADAELYKMTRTEFRRSPPGPTTSG